MSRKSGYYFVRFVTNKWNVARWSELEKDWQICGVKIRFEDSDFAEIDPNPIVRQNIPEITVLLDGEPVEYTHDKENGTITLHIPDEI